MKKQLIVSNRLSAKILDNGIYVKIRCDGKEYASLITLECDDRNGIYMNVEAPDWGNYFDLVKSVVTYHPKEQEFNEFGKWKREGRCEVRASKFIKYLTGVLKVVQTPDYNDYVSGRLQNRFIEILSSIIKASDFSEIKISDDPESVYNMPTSDSAGTLSSSCMRRGSGYSCSEYSEFYNVMGTKIVYIASEDERLRARALLWEDCEDRKGNKFTLVDRIYGNEDDIQLIKQWAIDNEFAHKKSQSCGSEIILPHGEEISYFSYKGKSPYNGKGFPYLDTLCYYNNSDSPILSTYSGEYRLQNTDANLCEHCASCGNEIDEDEGISINGELYCDNCCVYSEYFDCNMLECDAIYSKYHDSYLPLDDCVFIDEWADHVLDTDEIVRIRGSYYHTSSDSITFCEECGEYYLRREVVYNEELEQDLCIWCEGKYQRQKKEKEAVE